VILQAQQLEDRKCQQRHREEDSSAEKKKTPEEAEQDKTP